MTFCYVIHTFFRIKLIYIYTTCSKLWAKFFLFDFCFLRNYFISKIHWIDQSDNIDIFYIIIKIYTTIFHNVNKNKSFLSSKSAFYYFWMIK